jgi:hypothetical protein
MEKQIINFIVFIGICFVAYLLFRSMNSSIMEGMTADSSGNQSSSSVTNTTGIAGGAQSYSANIKSLVIKNQDVLLISKYRTDYENAILNLDDLVNSMMLQTALSIDPTKPEVNLKKIVDLNNVKAALNNVMKYIDRSH